MRSRGFGRKIAHGVIVLLLLFALPAALMATNHFVRAGASGNGSGADWTNAFTDVPASLVRGDTYYVAAGSYGSHTFQDPDSGTSVITINAATVADHGTDTAWSSSYVGQATFTAPIIFKTDYYVFNGAYRANTGQPWADWRNGSSYGFAINNNNGSNCPIATPAALQMGIFNGGSALTNITVEYVNIIGSGDFGFACNGEWGLTANSFPATVANIYFGYSYIHDTPSNPMLYDGVNPGTFEYNYIERVGEGDAAHHTEEITIRNNSDNIIVRYNFVGSCSDTGCVATPNLAGARSNWYMYGNILYVNSAEAPVSYSSGDGALSVFSGASITNFYFVNNTISSLPSVGPCGVFPWGVGTSSVFLENNVWFNCPQNNGPALGIGVTWDYNAYYASPIMHASDFSAHVSGIDSGAGSNPFVNVAQSAGANNFNLSADTTGGTSTANGTSLASLPPGCTAGVNCMNVDMNGTIRGANGTWDRGALQFTGGSTSGPAAPTALSVIVQ